MYSVILENLKEWVFKVTANETIKNIVEKNVAEIKSKFQGFVPCPQNKNVFYWFYHDMNLGYIIRGPFDTEEECGISIKSFGWWGV
jgi:hypothetical protein